MSLYPVRWTDPCGLLNVVRLCLIIHTVCGKQSSILKKDAAAFAGPYLCISYQPVTSDSFCMSPDNLPSIEYCSLFDSWQTVDTDTVTDTVYCGYAVLKCCECIRLGIFELYFWNLLECESWYTT